MKELVVAKYKEDVSWTQGFNGIVTIYNKDEKSRDKYSLNLPNIGRESHTYLYHIIKNYHQLSDVTIFSQGDPSPHLPGESPLKLYNNLSDNMKGFHPWAWYGGIKPQRYYGDLLPGEDDRRELEGSHYFSRLIKGPKTIVEDSIGKRCPDSSITHQNAQFAVSKDRILQHSLYSYIQLMSYHFWPNSETIPYELEYSWCIIFGCDYGS